MRRVYKDIIKSKIAKKDFSWCLKRIFQYFLIHASFFLERPLCGPILGTFVTNYRCNYRCKMCDLSLRGEVLKSKGFKELTTVQLKQLLKDFSLIGTSGVGFTGGEPLLREDIFELMKYAKDLGMVTHLNTNGSLLSEEKANELLDIGVDSINISLDGARPETHDSIRGHSGAFERVIYAISCLSKLRIKRQVPIRIKTVTVLSEDNIDEIPDLLKLSVALKTDCIEFIPEQHFNILSCPKGNNALRYSDKFLKKVDHAVAFLVRVKDVKVENSPRHLSLFRDSFQGKKSPLNCYAGYNSYGVDCYGLIYPCMPWFNWGLSVGNIREASLRDFWYSKEYSAIRRKISKCKDCYLNCQAELNLLFNLRIPCGLPQGRFCGSMGA